MEPLRSLLFVPGNRSDMLEKARNLRADALVPDMEDSVPAEEKSKARETIASELPILAEVGHKLVPRTNSLATGLLEEDLTAVIGPYCYGVTVGKVDSAWDVQQISRIIEPLERKAGLPPMSVKLIPWIETAKAIVNAYEICAASPRIVAVALGAEDFTNDMGIKRTDGGGEILYARMAIAVAARAADVLALDTPHTNFRDLEDLRRDAQVAQRYGFRGKFAIHPGQVETIESVFSPSPEDVEEARRILQAWNEAEAAGRGSTSLDGKMIDVPIVERARSLLALAEVIAQSQAGRS